MWIYSPARTVVDLFRMRRKLGESVAYVAPRRFLRLKGGSVAELVELARGLDVVGPVRGALDVLEAS